MALIWALPDQTTVRKGVGAAASGLVEVLVGSDPRPEVSRRLGRSILDASAAVGAALVAASVLLIVGTTLSLFGSISSPSPSGSNALLGRTEVLFVLPRLVMGSPGFIVLDLPVLMAGVGTLVLAARRPLMAWRLALLLSVLLPAVPAQTSLGPVEPLLFLWAAGRRSRPARWWMFALTLFPLWEWTSPGWERVAMFWVGLLAVTIALDAHGQSQRARRDLVKQSEQRRQEAARGAVLAERNRIARELHDVVAHHMSLIAVQAETAPYRVSELSGPALSEFAAISEQARGALTDMRKLLGVLRSDGPAERSPQPELADVAGLVAAARRAGMPVTFRLSDDALSVPPSVGLCAFRIMQEALSNAGRHAPGATVEVRVERTASALHLCVGNGRSAGTKPALLAVGPGHGLVGMRERVTMLGGSLSAGPAPDGGFVVSAVLPVDEPLPGPVALPEPVGRHEPRRRQASLAEPAP
jgi:signal transduction histidine kinase